MKENEKRFDAEEEAAEDRVPEGARDLEQPKAKPPLRRTMWRVMIKAQEGLRFLRFPLEIFRVCVGRRRDAVVNGFHVL